MSFFFFSFFFLAGLIVNPSDFVFKEIFHYFLFNASERDGGSMGGRDRGGRMSDMGPDKTDTDWRARPSSDHEDRPPRRDDAFGESESWLPAAPLLLK